jgi:predicted RNA-binding protein with RPS1 domain
MSDSTPPQEPLSETPAATDSAPESSRTEGQTPHSAAVSTDDATCPGPTAGSPSTEESPNDAPGRPSERIRIGSQRPVDKTQQEPAEAPKPVNAVTAAKPAAKPSKYPPPNVRAALTPEQEAELEAELAGMSLDSMIDESAATAAGELAPETKLTGKVASIHGESVFVDLGGHRQGAVPLKQFHEEPPAVGADLEVVVARLNNDEGLYELSLSTAAVDIGNWDDIQVGQIVEVMVTGHNKGGLECQTAGIRGFMPMGQISLYRVETPEDYVNQKLAAVVTEANRDRRNLVLSHRAVMERERAEKKEKLLAELAPGQLREGVVRSLRDFGAFVDLGGVDGLIHVSKMSWDRIKHPSEVLTEGQAVKVRIDRIDPDTGKISLSYRDSATNPWDGVEGKYPIGTRVNGTVSKIMDFGAFVRLEAGVEGLIHISELAHGRVFRTSDVLSEGQQVEVKVQSVDREKQRISLSLKALLEPPKKKGEKEQVDDEDLIVPAEPPKGPRKKAEQLKGGTGGPTGGDKFGLKW